MSKLQPQDEHGRAKALERYTKPEPQSEYGHSKMGEDLKRKYQDSFPTEKKGEGGHG